jgi:hypothetical protein
MKSFVQFKRDVINTLKQKVAERLNTLRKEIVLGEKLDLTSGSVSDAIARAIRDFRDSDAPQFKGKSDEEIRDMAVAAVYQARGIAKGD